MQLTRYTDYSLRVLIYLSLHQHKLVTIEEITEYYNISRNHLMKVVHDLSLKGFIETTRGKNGGMRLATEPDRIRIGDVVRRMEPSLNIVECITVENETCRVAPICSLKSVLDAALANFLGHLDQYTLADATINNASMKSLDQILVKAPSLKKSVT